MSLYHCLYACLKESLSAAILTSIFAFDLFGYLISTNLSTFFLILFFLWHFFFGYYWDSIDILVFNYISYLSTESSGQSNSISIIPYENFHHEEPFENNIHVPYHNNLILVDVVDQFCL